ncbi:MAG: divalent-cation tolerance protein CutA [Candidatus Alkanophagales archaeon]
MREVVVFCTSKPEEAGRIARSVVEKRLAACVNVVAGVRSSFWWQGAVQDETESLLIMKTTEDKLDALIKHVKEIHSYEVPEIIALPIIGGYEAYLGWLRDAVG